MQAKVGQNKGGSEPENSAPICDDGNGFCGVVGFASNLIELPINTAGFGIVGQAGLDEFETLELSSFEVMPVDSADFAPAWSGSRPSDKFFLAGHEGQTEFGFKASNGSPIGAQDSKRVYNDDMRFVKADLWRDEEYPDGDVDYAQDSKNIRQAFPSAGDGDGQEGAKGNHRGANRGVETYSRSNGFHASNYPHQDATLAQTICEDK